MNASHISPAWLVAVGAGALFIFLGLQGHGVFQKGSNPAALRQWNQNQVKHKKAVLNAYVKPKTGTRQNSPKGHISSQFDSSRQPNPQRGSPSFDVQRMPNGSLKLHIKPSQLHTEYYTADPDGLRAGTGPAHGGAGQQPSEAQQ